MKSQSQILRNVIYKIYEWLSSEYKKNKTFDSFYQMKMTQIINYLKNKI